MRDECAVVGNVRKVFDARKQQCVASLPNEAPVPATSASLDVVRLL